MPGNDERERGLAAHARGGRRMKTLRERRSAWRENSAAAAFAATAAAAAAAASRDQSSAARGGLFRVEDVECRQADVGDFFLAEFDLAIRRGVSLRSLFRV
jgi:anti-sigma-K factor RskA